ncbi:MAG: YggS family pyridoxal phosphate-dependent enzyme [Actinobacteria bacterium]|nr:MAG: YggS family pyridoxal phosphate-dependent enzyme [Actinomycetota bacterium]
MTPGRSIAENIERLRSRIEAAKARSAHPEREVTLVAVTKTVPVDRIEEALEAGVADVGENRVQEALPKVEAIGPGPVWHFIGYLQRNKVKQAVSFAGLIQSVDRLELLEEIERRAGAAGKVQDVLIEVNVSGEASKSGVGPAGIEELLDALGPMKHVRVKGLMTMAPLVEDAEKVRPVFRKLAEIFVRLGKERRVGVEMVHLSMGMTDDFEVAVEEGATMVRIGRAIFAE